MSEQFKTNRVQYHAASRVAIKETDPLLNALNLDQHTVLTSKVWASTISDFPKNRDLTASGGADWKNSTDGYGATNDLVKVFTNDQAGQYINNSSITTTYFNGTDASKGLIYENASYPAVKLFYRCEMRAVEGSKGTGDYSEAFELVDTNGIRYMDWVSPVSAFDPSIDKPIPGYTGILEATKNGTDWSPAQDFDKTNWNLLTGNWEFVYYAGMVIFDANNTPLHRGASKLRWTGFQYVGVYLDQYLDTVQYNLQDELHAINLKAKNVFAGAPIADTINLDKYIKPGIVRIANNIAGNTPDEEDITGYLQVIEIDHDQVVKDWRIRVRQFIYPDGSDSSTSGGTPFPPYTRNGIGTIDQVKYNELLPSPFTLTGQEDGELNWDKVDWTTLVSGDIIWSEWTTLGSGNSLKRVKLTSNMTAKKNIMYYSFDNFTLTLPDPTTLKLGVQVGLEQYANYGAVVYDTQYQLASPLYGIMYDADGESTMDQSECIGCGTYVFTVVADNAGNHVWFLETATDNTGAIDALNNRLTSASKVLYSYILGNRQSMQALSSAMMGDFGPSLTSVSSALNSKINSVHEDLSSHISTNRTRIDALEGSVPVMSTNFTKSFDSIVSMHSTHVAKVSASLNTSISALDSKFSKHVSVDLSKIINSSVASASSRIHVTKIVMSSELDSKISAMRGDFNSHVSSDLSGIINASVLSASKQISNNISVASSRLNSSASAIYFSLTEHIKLCNADGSGNALIVDDLRSSIYTNQTSISNLSSIIFTSSLPLVSATAASALDKANTASTNASNALSKANTASTTAVAAANTAASALDKANDAYTTATSALNRANLAITTAGSALTVANSASTLAVNASAAASAASAKAVAGSNLAYSASTRANAAYTLAGSASTTATNALTKANIASTLAVNASAVASIALAKANEASTIATNASKTASLASAKAVAGSNVATAASNLAVAGSNLASNASVRANSAYNTASLGSAKAVAASNLITAHTAQKHYSKYGYFGALNSASIVSQLNQGRDVHIFVNSGTVTLPTCNATWASSGLVVTVDCVYNVSVIAGSDGNEYFSGSYTLPFEATLTGASTAGWRLVVAG